MLWFFERGAEVTRLETRVDNNTNEYVLIIEPPDKPRREERYPTKEAFEARLVVLEQELAADNWKQRGDPHILPDGWRGPMTN